MKLDVKSDERGELAEFIKSKDFGQVFVVRSRPGATRGNHYHCHKVEKFLIVEGIGIIRLRQVNSSIIKSHPVGGEGFEVIDIPPMHVHSIQNAGKTDLVTVVWASEVFDPKDPDTFEETV